MSTNTSQNLGLHLWEPTDQVLRTEFNQNWQKIDTAVNAAQETAEAAQTAANAVSNAYTPGNKPFKVGSYSGNGSTQTIELGFKPSLVIIYQEVGAYTDGELGGDHFMISTGLNYPDKVSFTSTGFKVGVSSSIPYPRVNGSPFSYLYVAFR